MIADFVTQGRVKTRGLPAGDYRTVTDRFVASAVMTIDIFIVQDVVAVLRTSAVIERAAVENESASQRA